MTRRWGLVAAMPAAVAGIALATLGASAGSSAGKPTADTRLLCGTWTFAADQMKGNSPQDHPSGSAATGDYISNASPNQKCSDGDFSGSKQMFTWTVGHSNVNLNSQRGTEHGVMTFTDARGNAISPVTKFNGRISVYDPTDSNGDHVFYASSGRFNTLGGAETGNHFFGSYATVVYQTTGDSNSPCDSSSKTYCFQANVSGKTN